VDHKLKDLSSTAEHLPTGTTINERVGHTVADVVVRNITEFQPFLHELCLINPVFYLGHCWPVAQSAGQGKFTESDWSVCINLCEVLLEREDIRISLERLNYVGWCDVRVCILDLLAVEVNKRENRLPPPLRLRIRDLLILLLSDPDPDRATDRPSQGWDGYEDPHTLALNHVVQSPGSAD